MFFLFTAFGLMASAISANKVLLYALKPEFLVGIRMTLGGALLGTYTFFHTKHRLRWHALKPYIPLLLMVALFTTYFPSNLKAYALAHMPSSKMAFFGTLDPFVTALYTYFFFKERLSLTKVFGIIIGFLGMMILILGTADIELQAFSVFSYPELAAFWAIVLSRFGWIQAQQLLKKEIVNPVQINVIIMIVGGIISLLTAFLRDQTTAVPLLHAPLSLFLYFPLSWLNSQGLLVLFLAYTIIVGNVFGYTLYAQGLKQHSAIFISLASFSIPLFVSFFGWLFLNEPLSMSFFLACAVTFMGLLVFYLDERKSIY